ncbi:MAG: PHP domain-containing protein [Clostridia bacterium]|nr:PHP domain-containing protein [Clostridia bacterium]
MLKADLHIHSTVSDGSDSIQKIIDTANAKGLDYIAITDHDTVSHFSQIPLHTGVTVIPGVEVSSVDRTGRRVHVLGYRLKRPEIVAAFAQPTLEARNRNSEKQVQILIEHGLKIDVGSLLRADGKYLYKQHIMDWLVSTGQAYEMFGSFYKSTFKNSGICHFDIEYADAFDAVDSIKEAGGLAVLAHSGQQQNFDLIPELVKHGLDGLELNHHSNSEKDKAIIRGYAEKFGLFMTGGSDYHGRYEPQPFGIGDFLSDESGVRAICCV